MKTSKICSPLLPLDISPRLRETIAALGFTHDPALLAPLAALVPDSCVDALTLAGTVDEVRTRVMDMVQRGIQHVMIYPIAPDGHIERIIQRFAHEVVPCVPQRAGG